MVKIIAIGVIALVLGLVIGYVVGNSGTDKGGTDTTSAFPSGIASEWHSFVNGSVTAITNETITIDKVNLEDPTQPPTSFTVTLDLLQEDNQSPVQIYHQTEGEESRQEDSSVSAIQTGDEVSLRITTMDGAALKADYIVIFKNTETENGTQPPTTDIDDEASL